MASELPPSPKSDPELSTLTIFCIFTIIYERVVKLIALFKKKVSQFSYNFGLLHSSRASQITKGSLTFVLFNMRGLRGRGLCQIKFKDT